MVTSHLAKRLYANGRLLVHGHSWRHRIVVAYNRARMKVQLGLTPLVFVVLAIIAIACGAVLSESQTQLPKQNAHYWPSAVWRTSTPEAQGINSERLADAM